MTTAPFTIQHRVPWSDVDLAKIVYFPRFFSYFEMAELEYYRQKGLSYEALLEGLGVWMPRVAAHCNYRHPARLAELLEVEMHLARLGRTSYTFGYDVYRVEGRVHLADGTITIATVSKDEFKPTPVPEELIAHFEDLPRGPEAGEKA